jgi:hypothetical protein
MKNKYVLHWAMKVRKYLKCVCICVYVCVCEALECLQSLKASVSINIPSGYSDI